ncbi:chromosome transmission fidelity protein 18 homolog [Bufo gargarizans]|uniref:chromosome transmission fidelity protein 18 homolog n=1 Tax=Bufo gargarizans TaxID=30331 RepID=UPI001CF586B1|nr:chromosome transmission fidelity protein 18 homolog [Bufo gargarizans]
MFGGNVGVCVRDMDEYDLYGIEDEYEAQFSSELEVLAELEDDPPSRYAPKTSRFREKLSFEEAITSGDHVGAADSHSANGSLAGTTSKKRGAAFLHLSEEDELSDSLLQPPPTPKAKRPKLEAVKKLDFGATERFAASPTPSDDITPPPSPDPTQKKDRNLKFLSCDVFDVSDMAPLQVTPTETEQKRVLTRPPVLEDYINVTSSDGTRVYMTLRDDQDGTGVQEPSKITGLSWRGDQQLHLLGVPISYIKEQVADERRRQVLEESQRLSEMLNSQMNEFEEVENESSELVSAEAEEEGNDASSHNLWVDRYSPKYYTELLSDDYTNRCLLKWLKLWDTVVFGKEKTVKKPKAVPDQRANNKFQFQKDSTVKWKSKAQITEEILEAELDQYNRPKNKVALLCGPPGLGKTTLAHIIARHAGYNVVEMNASDDRSAEVFRTRIEAATQMKSVLGMDERPNCLIIDEIDGAPTVSINMLLSLINRKDGKDNTEGGNELAPTKKKKKEGGLMLRPIICICNDQYVPSLRQLRQQAFMLNFPQTMPSRLVQRLYEITFKQGMKADTGALMALCEKTDNDIRSCINTLQFLHGKGRKELNLRTVQTMKIGLKDQNKGLFSVWQEIFQLPKVQRKRIGQDVTTPDLQLLLTNNDPLNLLGRTPLSVLAQRFHHILHLTMATGEYEKLTLGLYDNFLNMKVKESSFGTVVSALDWLGFTDIVNTTIMHGQNFQLMRYLPFLPVAFHLFFAASNIPRIAYPNSHYEAQSRLNQMQNLLSAMVSEISPSIRSRVGPQSLVLDALCLLLDVISPKLRPVNTQLYSMKEKQQLADLINTMLAYNLTYHQERTMDGQYVYKLDPNVEDVCRFPELPARKQLTYQAKQLIAREIELEKMRRSEAFQQARNARKQDNTSKSEEKPGKESVVKPPAKPATLNHEQRLETIMKKTTFEEKPEKDFFGRQIVKKVISIANGIQEDTIEKKIGTAVGNSHVWFRFNEGVSNAVRRNVYIKDLL